MIRIWRNTLGAMSPRARAWARTIAVLGGSLATYVAVALLGTWLTGDAIAGAALSDLAAAGLAILYRRRSTGRIRAQRAAPRARTFEFWLTATTALVTCWLAGQTAAVWIYANWGSEGFDAVNAAKMSSPGWLVAIAFLFLAPLGEESLMRGIAFPELRRHWRPLASAFVTAAVFSLLHGNLVQIALTLPLGLLLAFVYEAAQRLWPVVLMHILFNTAAAVVPSKLVEQIANPGVILSLLVACGVLLFALTPGRYPVELGEKAADAAR